MRTAGVLLACLAAVAAGCGSGSSDHTATSSTGAGRKDLTLSFGAYKSHAQLTYPTTAGRHPAVVLIPGSGPEDLDANICFPPGNVLSHNFADIAKYLTRRGYAVLRYDKHGVTGPCRGSLNTVPLPRLLSDAGMALAAAKNDPHVDARHVFVYGWSEGSTVAAALVVAHPEVAGLIIQDGVVRPWKQVYSYQTLKLGIPYLRSLASDGRVTAAVLRQAASGDGGGVTKGILRYVAAPSSVQGHYAINPRLDTNHDGALEIDSEVVPAVPKVLGFLLSPTGPLHVYAPAQALPVLSQQAAKLTLPVLYLQGQHDANVPAAGATALQATLASKDKTLRRYPGLGHSLGPAPSVIGDDFAPIAARPLADLVRWLDKRRG